MLLAGGVLIGDVPQPSINPGNMAGSGDPIAYARFEPIAKRSPTGKNAGVHCFSSHTLPAGLQDRFGFFAGRRPAGLLLRSPASTCGAAGFRVASGDRPHLR